MLDDRARTPALARKRGFDLGNLLAGLPLNRLPAVVLPTATAVAFLLAWEVFTALAKIPPAILPPPSMIFEQLVEHFPLILKHTVPTTLETLLAFGISIPLGIVLAGLMVYSTLAFRALYPNIVFFQLIPKIALAPLFIVWLGIGSSSRVTCLGVCQLFPLLL